ncbi:MAG: NAD-dependent epimerase/dehydratase family protein [Gaiellaceae bacterium]
MTYLVTGGGGFIGSHLVEALVDRGDDAVVLDDFSTGQRDNLARAAESALLDLVEGSMLDLPLVASLMERADVCIHLASAVGVKMIVQRPVETLLTNVRGNDAVISTAAEHGVRLIFISTSEVYGKNSADSLREDADRLLGSPFKSRWAYATAKAFGEALANSYWVDRAARMTVVRLFNTVGPRQSSAYGMVLPRFVQQALRGEDVTVFGDGTQSRCFIHVADTVAGILSLVEPTSSFGRAFNVGSDEQITISELAAKVIERVGSASQIRFVPYEDAYGAGFEELGRRRPDTGAIESLTGWRRMRSLEETLDDVIAFERARQAGDALAPSASPAASRTG